MKGPAETVANIFTAAISLLVVVTIYNAFFLEDFGIIRYVITNFAFPFFATLVIVFVAVSILEGGFAND